MRSASFILAAGLALAASMGLPSSAWAGAATIDNTTQYQVIDGFGAASVWNSGQISAALAKVFWTDESGLAPASQTNGNCGLSIERMLIDPAENWASEAGNAQLAVQTNPNIIVFGSAWSPPVAYKQNGKTAGNNTGNSNFNPGSNSNVFVSSAANYTGYANHLVKFVQAMKSTYGVNVYAVSPQNEPDYDTSYDSCLWTPQQFHDLIGTYLGPALKTAGLNTKIMTPESFADNQAGSNTTMADTAVAPYVSIIGMHLYGGGPTAIPASYATNAGHYVGSWVTEMSDFATNDPSMTNGMKYAQQVHTCIVDKAFNAYCFWWLINQNSDNEGLCDNTKTPTKKLYVMGNFAKFIRPGFMRIAATEAPSSGIQVSAYCNTATAKAVIVAINSSGSSVSQAFNLGGSLSVATVYPWITDSSRNLVQQTAQAVSGGSFTYTLPSMSVVTFLCPITGSSSTATSSATPSRTPTATSTRTATPALSFTSSATPSSSASSSSTPTGTRSATPTSSSSPTPQDSATRTSTPTNTVLASPTASPTASGTPSASPSPTAAAEPSGSPTASSTPLDTATRTSTHTGTATQSATASHSPSASATPTESSTFTQGPSATSTSTPTFTGSSTASSTATLSGTTTLSSTPTATQSATGTATPTATSTASSSATSSSSPTRTLTSTASSTATPSGTATSTFTALPTGTITPDPTPGFIRFRVLKVVPVPNPQQGSELTLYVQVQGSADSLEVRLFSVAMVQVADLKAPGGRGWVQARMPLPSLPTGTYYGIVIARQGSQVADSPIFKVVHLR